MSAARWLSPDAARLEVRDAATLASTASPSAPPIMNAVFTTPDASPASVWSTSFIAASSTGLKAIPAPKPRRIMLGSTSVTKFPSTGSRMNSAKPRVASPRPIPSGRAMPKRITSLAERPIENTAMIRLDGRNASPIWSGLYPSTDCMYSALRKNHANIAAAQKTPTTLAVEKLRILKSRSGTSGERTCDSSQRNTASNTAEPPRSPSVCVEVHPAWFPFTIA